MNFFYSLKDAADFSDKHNFFVSYKNVFFPIYLDFKGGNDWVVFTPGACSRAKPMPIFQRSSYSNNLDCNVLSLFDPGLLLNKNLTNTWFSGTPARYYGEYISEIIKSFFWTPK